jgi:hypothetical protein
MGHHLAGVITAYSLSFVLMLAGIAVIRYRGAVALAVANFLVDGRSSSIVDQSRVSALKARALTTGIFAIGISAAGLVIASLSLFGVGQ